MSTEPQPAAVFYADVWVGKDGRAHIEVPQKRREERREDFPAGTTVRVEVVL
jgi:hypothetical protein